MNTLVKKITLGLFTIILAITFGAATNSINDDFVWFELDELGIVTTPDQGTSQPSEICEDEKAVYCSVAFSIEDVENNNDTAPLLNVDNNLNDPRIKKIMYRPE